MPPPIKDASVSTLETAIPLSVYGMAIVVFGRAIKYPFIQPLQENMTALVQPGSTCFGQTF
jgi:hypothetical protein